MHLLSIDRDCWNQGQSSKTPGSQESGKDTLGGGDSGNVPNFPVDVLCEKCPEDCLLYYSSMSGNIVVNTFKYLETLL